MQSRYLPEYSVIIRTTGEAHEKYQKLLDSISRLVPQPKELIVVLPEGYALPREQLGWETFYFCPKGMVIQRLTGIQKCKTQYALICDDDVCFEKDFVAKLFAPVLDGMYGFSSGPLYSFLPEHGMRGMLTALVGSAAPTVFHRDRYTTVLRTTGYSYNRHLRLEMGRYDTQSLAWTCFFADLEAFKKIDYESEIWLDRHGYSAMDDQTMFYKAWLRGIKTAVVTDASYEHLSAQTSRNDSRKLLLALVSNRLIFWHRFIYSQEKNWIMKLWAIFCITYRCFWIFVRYFCDVMLRKLSWPQFQTVCEGFKDGRVFLRSEEYRTLKPVRNG